MWEWSTNRSLVPGVDVPALGLPAARRRSGAGRSSWSTALSSRSSQDLRLPKVRRVIVIVVLLGVAPPLALGVLPAVREVEGIAVESLLGVRFEERPLGPSRTWAQRRRTAALVLPAPGRRWLRRHPQHGGLRRRRRCCSRPPSAPPARANSCPASNYQVTGRWTDAVDAAGNHRRRSSRCSCCRRPSAPCSRTPPRGCSARPRPSGSSCSNAVPRRLPSATVSPANCTTASATHSAWSPSRRPPPVECSPPIPRSPRPLWPRWRPRPGRPSPISITCSGCSATTAGPGSQTAPQATLGDLDRLVEATRAGGITVERTIAPAISTSCRAAVSREAYRIIQEGLTNAIRHAGRPADRLTVATCRSASTPPGSGWN